MRNAPTFIALMLAVFMAGCVMSGKPKSAVPAAPVAAKPAPLPTPPPAPVALSIPQTQVVLPRPQAVDEAALSPNAPPPVVEVVEAPAPAKPTPARRSPATTTNPAPPLAVPSAEPTPPTIQEIVPAAETKRLQEQAQARRRDVQQMLDQLGRRQAQLNPTQRGVVTNINSFLASSLDAEKRGDMKLADALADRAQILARDLINGK
jgi:hypothetical protein